MKENYIRLLTDVELNPKQKHVWYRVVEQFLGATHSPDAENYIDTLVSDRDELEGDEDFPYVYAVYLSDVPDVNHAEMIVHTWDRVYPRDFQIETSADFDPSQCDCGDEDGEGYCSCDIEIDDDLHEEIQRRASKFLHNRWVEHQVHQGWRYGLKLNEGDRTDPRLRDWDSLREEYRRTLDMDRDQAVKFFKTYPHLFV